MNNWFATPQFPDISLRVITAENPITLARIWNFVHWLLVFVAKFYVSKLQVTIIGADFIINMIFTIIANLNNRVVQEPYQDEARQAMDGMKRVWQEGDPKPTGFLFDLFGGEGEDSSALEGRATALVLVTVLLLA